MEGCLMDGWMDGWMVDEWMDRCLMMDGCFVVG